MDGVTHLPLCPWEKIMEDTRLSCYCWSNEIRSTNCISVANESTNEHNTDCGQQLIILIYDNDNTRQWASLLFINLRTEWSLCVMVSQWWRKYGICKMQWVPVENLRPHCGLCVGLINLWESSQHYQPHKHNWYNSAGDSSCPTNYLLIFHKHKTAPL